jgi:hypothetical protein
MLHNFISHSECIKRLYFYIPEDSHTVSRSTYEFNVFMKCLQITYFV